MYCAVVSDIHSNLEAFEAVLREIEKRKPDKIISPGDVVGYGADPGECLKLATQHCQEIVLGNHDEAVENITLRDDFNPDAREAVEWTAGVLSKEDQGIIRHWTRLVIDQENDVTLAHGSPYQPEEYYYVLGSYQARIAFPSFSTSVCFIGHTHVPALFSEKGAASYLVSGRYSLRREDRYLINPGSVGQPRDRDKRASLAFYDSEKLELEIVRLDYDNWKAADKIKKAGLPAFLAERLL